MKECSICKRYLDLSHFSIAKKHSSGHFTQCRECRKKRRAELDAMDKTSFHGQIPFRKDRLFSGTTGKSIRVYVPGNGSYP